MDKTTRHVVIDQSHRLHKRIRRLWTEESPAQLLQILCQPDRVLSLRDSHPYHVRHLDHWRLVAPNEGPKRTIGLHDLTRALRIVDGRFDLTAMTHDTGIF